MPNPMFSNRTSPTHSTSPNNPLNDSNKRYSQKYNKFNYGRKVYNTLRYADITPFEVVHGVEGDKLPFGSKHQIRTYTLGQPFMSDIFMRKSFFHVDMRAILPINWDKFYKQPNIGDDVIAEEVGTYCLNFLGIFEFIRDELSTLDYSTSPYNTNRIGIIDLLFKYLFLFESVFSNGSLLSSLGCHLGSCVKSNNFKSIDSLFDSVCDSLSVHKLRYKINDTIYASSDAVVQYGDSTLAPMRVIVDLMRNHPDFEVLLPYGDTSVSDEAYADIINNFKTKFFGGFTISGSQGINLDVLYAYQIVCSQFYTNPNVDYIYNAQLYRDNQKSLFVKCFTERTGTFSYDDFRFTYNGVDYEYDICSGYCLYNLLYASPSALFSNYSSSLVYYFGFLHNIFSYQRSLRYGDYFTGAKTRPLAVGDVSTSVVDNKVNALDLTRNLMKQRFLNAVGRIRNSMSDYLSDVMDGTQSPRDDEPRYLATVTSRVSGFEVENTAEEQGNIVTILKSGDSNYVYEVNVGSPCIILGLASFEVPRVYSKTIDRFFFHIDRYDMFNKFMQYIGDQDIKKGEINGRYINNLTPYAYTLRHMEYKQRFPIAAGGFVNNLNGWLMVTDNYDSKSTGGLFQENEVLSPEYIRNKNYEMDRFYKSLTGYSLGSYFHFIVSFDNVLNSSRQMAYAPSIL